MKASEVRELSSEEMQNKVGDLKQELFNLRFQQATGQLENPARMRHVKKDIARILTILRERELKEASL